MLTLPDEITARARATWSRSQVTTHRRRLIYTGRAGRVEVRRVQYDGEDFVHSFPAFGPERADTWGLYIVDPSSGQLDWLAERATFKAATVAARLAAGA